MQLNRRRLLGGVAAASLVGIGEANAQVLKGLSGKIVMRDGKVLMRPPIPAPASGTLLATQVTLTNPAGQPTQANPYFSFGLPIAKGGFPASGYKLTLNDATGVTHIADLQVDQVATGWSDGTINHCVVSGYATGTTLAAGATATFTIKAEVGVPFSQPKILLPAYFYPGALWTQVDATLPSVSGSYVVMDPTSLGAGASIDPNYVTAANNARAAGLNLIGYSDTQNGTRSAAAVKTDIDNYKAWYGIDNIFLDVAATTAAKIPYYQDLANYVHQTPGAIVVLNPGTIPDEGYMTVGDIVIIFEDTYTNYLTWAPPSWVSNYPSKIANIAYNVPDQASMLNAVSLAKARGAAYIYFNNDVTYSTLPSYWTQELAALSPIPPACTTATLAANSDLKAVCKIGVDTYTVSINNIISLYSGAQGAHPQGSVKIWKSGPTSLEGAFGQYLKRDSDGASHRWAFLKVYVTALSASGPFVMRALLENTQCFGANPVGTIGSNMGPTTTGLDVVDQIEFYNGATFIGAMGGINDTRNGTFAPSAVNLTTGALTVSFASGQTPVYAPVGFANTGGSLPSGMSPAASATFWLTWGRVTGTVIPVINRWYAARIIEGSLPYLPAAPVSGTTYALNSCYVGNGGYYAVTTAGVSTGAIPTAVNPGDTFADNSAGGALVWKLISPRVTSQGTGSHTMTLKAAIWRASKAAMMGADTYPHWSGAGSLPKLLVGYDFTYLTTQTKSVPPLDPTITTAAWNGSLPVYFNNNIDLPGNTSFKDLGGTGESLVDDRVNIFSPTAAASIYRPTDPGFAMSIRAIALSWMDRQGLFFRDETAQQVLVCNYGPNKAGSTYPGMGPSVPNTYIGSPTSPIGCAVDQANWPGYGGDFSSTNGPGDCSHMPSPCYWPYLTSGDPLFLDALIEQASSNFSGGGYGQQVKTAVVNGVRYSWAWDLYAQARGSGWKLKIFSGAEWLVPDSHASKQYFSDVMDDSANVGLPYMQATMGPIAQSTGYVPLAYAVVNGTTLQSIEPWMVTYLQAVMCWEAWKGNRPGFKTFLEGYFAHMITDLYDSDVGGSINVIGAQFSLVGTGTSSTNPPTESTVIVPAQNRFIDLGPPWSTAFPPPGTGFVSGIQSQSQHVYVYYTPKVDTNSYVMATRAACVFGAAAGIPVYQKLLDRINAVTTAQYGGVISTWVQTGFTGNQNGLMWAFAKPS